MLMFRFVFVGLALVAIQGKCRSKDKKALQNLFMHLQGYEWHASM